jgi:serine/threonine-protein kinase
LIVKACSKCQRLFPDDARFCPIDGGALKPAEEVPVDKDPEDKRIGARICKERYEIRRKVADGGMGRVYQGLDFTEQRGVAIKVLHPEVAMDEVAVERFKREFSLSAKLPHDHIVEVRDFQETEDESYALVMEYLEGEELRMFMQREKLVRPERVVRILSQLAIGLKQPHELKLVHRDIKPDNIFLCGTEEGPVVKLLDFGSVRDNSEGAKKLTVVGTTIGSPFYMSPEQAQGLPDLDHRADVWSIAAIAYEALTGKVPFYGASGPQILLAILGQEPKPPSLVTNDASFTGDKVPEALDDVISDALSKDPMIRVGSVAELADRFGAAYGLEGSHLEWARVPEDQLRTRIEEGLKKPRTGQNAAAAQLRKDLAAMDAAMAGANPPPPVGAGTAGDPFRDDEYIMGVPDQSSSKKTWLIVGVAVVLVLVGGILFALMGQG